MSTRIDSQSEDPGNPIIKKGATILLGGIVAVAAVVVIILLFANGVSGGAR